MPVIPHPTHPDTVQNPEAKYLCNGKPRVRHLLRVKTGYDIHGNLGMQFIKDFGSLECRYDRSLQDVKCAGCQHAGSGEAYAAHVKEQSLKES